MFTGIIEKTGRICSIDKITHGFQICIESDIFYDCKIGESISVNGVCLTCVEIQSNKSKFDLLDITFEITNLKHIKSGDYVNLERSLRIGDRLSGHFVQGHIDSCDKIISYKKIKDDHELIIEVKSDFFHLLALKGSICVNGVSLTVAKLDNLTCTSYIIPMTHNITNFNYFKKDLYVNLEFDILAKHISKLVQNKDSF